MKVLVNALSVTNQSGRHVLMGHLNQLRELGDGRHEFVILYHDSNRDIVAEESGFEWLECPSNTSRWLPRTIWEYRNLNRVLAETSSDFVFTPAGVSVPGIRAPQVVFCQNPWCLVRSLHDRSNDRLKAWIQRRAYRRTMRQAELMIFNSHYMHDAYKDNARSDAKNAMVVYQAISDDTWEAANRLGKSMRQRGHIVSVSAMAPHKGADVLVKAMKLVCDQGVDARLTFAGGWPNKAYRKLVENLVNELGLDERVTFCGWITDDELHELYSSADAFCLLSKCESFGIPAVEAQAFGTPALGTDTCAIPEIGGNGGLYAKVGDPESAADNLVRVLTDDELWNQLSKNASDNALKYRWSECSRPLLEMFSRVQSDG